MTTVTPKAPPDRREQATLLADAAAGNLDRQVLGLAQTQAVVALALLAADAAQPVLVYDHLRPPSQPAKAEPHAVKAWSADEAYGTRDRLIALALSAASGYYQRDGLPAQVSAAAEMDAAAREHVTALLGPATGGVIAAPRVVLGSDLDDAAATYVTAERESAEMESAYLRRKAALAAVLRQFAARSVKAGGYEPAKLAPGSVVVADGRVYVKDPARPDDFLDWRVFPKLDYHDKPGQIGFVGHSRVPTTGVLVVDGDTLGVAR